MTAPDIEENTIAALFQNIVKYWETQTFCDLTIFGQENDIYKGIKCHSLVLCSVAPALKNLLLEENDEEKFIFLPEIEFMSVSKFISEIYQGLNSNDFSLNFPEDLGQVFGMIGNENAYNTNENTKDSKNKVENFEIVVESDGQNEGQNDQIELILPDGEDGEDGTYLVDASNLEEKSISVRSIIKLALRNQTNGYFTR